MATHSSILAWRIPGTEEPGGLPSMGSHRVGHDWSDLAAAAVWILRKENGQSHVFTWWRLRREEEMIKLKYLQTINPKGNQPWIFIGRTMTKLRLQYFGHLMQRTDSLEKTLMLGKIEGKRRKGRQRMRWLDGITNSMDMNLSKIWKTVKDQGSRACCSPWGRRESDTT